VFAARYELNSYIVFRKRLVSKRLAARGSKLTRSLHCGMSLRRNKQRSETVLIRNCCLLRLSVTKRRSVAVVQTRAAADICCASLFCWRKAQGSVQFCAWAPKRRWYQQEVVLALCCEGDLF
jgi:hypothetical protein